jgi:hypothetical protein
MELQSKSQLRHQRLRATKRTSFRFCALPVSAATETHSLPRDFLSHRMKTSSKLAKRDRNSSLEKRLRAGWYDWSQVRNNRGCLLGPGFEARMQS